MHSLKDPIWIVYEKATIRDYVTGSTLEAPQSCPLQSGQIHVKFLAHRPVHARNHHTTYEVDWNLLQNKTF